MEKANKQKTALISNTSKNDQWLQSSKIDYFAKATVSQTGHQSSMCQKHLKKKKGLENYNTVVLRENELQKMPNIKKMTGV